MIWGQKSHIFCCVDIGPIRVKRPMAKMTIMTDFFYKMPMILGKCKLDIKLDETKLTAEFDLFRLHLHVEMEKE
jgi:hypothetical protein